MSCCWSLPCPVLSSGLRLAVSPLERIFADAFVEPLPAGALQAAGYAIPLRLILVLEFDPDAQQNLRDGDKAVGKVGLVPGEFDH